MARTPTRASAFACALLALSGCVVAQEMPGKGMTCWDKRELCDLNCVFATTHDGESGLAECSTDCMETQASCSDSDATVLYISCSTDCATTYDSSLTKCNQQTSDQTKATYGANLDACSNVASGIMDDCMETCYGQDRFNGWTPQTEEGVDAKVRLPGLEDDVWRHPFRAKSTIIGRVRGETASYPAP